jgi:hypothetical protein
MSAHFPICRNAGSACQHFYKHFFGEGELNRVTRFAQWAIVCFGQLHTWNLQHVIAHIFGLLNLTVRFMHYANRLKIGWLHIGANFSQTHPVTLQPNKKMFFLCTYVGHVFGVQPRNSWKICRIVRILVKKWCKMRVRWHFTNGESRVPILPIRRKENLGIAVVKFDSILNVCQLVKRNKSQKMYQDLTWHNFPLRKYVHMSRFFYFKSAQRYRNRLAAGHRYESRQVFRTFLRCCFVTWFVSLCMWTTFKNIY